MGAITDSVSSNNGLAAVMCNRCNAMVTTIASHVKAEYITSPLASLNCRNANIIHNANVIIISTADTMMQMSAPGYCIIPNSNPTQDTMAATAVNTDANEKSWFILMSFIGYICIGSPQKVYHNGWQSYAKDSDCARGGG